MVSVRIVYLFLLIYKIVREVEECWDLMLRKKISNESVFSKGSLNSYFLKESL